MRNRLLARPGAKLGEVLTNKHGTNHRVGHARSSSSKHGGSAEKKHPFLPNSDVTQ